MAIKEQKFDKKSVRMLINEHVSFLTYVIAIIYGLLVILFSYGFYNPLFPVKIENTLIGGRAILAVIVGTALFTVNPYVVYIGIFLMIIAAIMLVLHLPGSHYVSTVASSYLLLLTIIGSSVLMLVSFVITLLLTLKTWDTIDLVNIIRRSSREIHK